MKFHSNLDGERLTKEKETKGVVIFTLGRLCILIVSGIIGLTGSFLSTFAGVFACTSYDFNLWYICFFTISGPLIIPVLGVFGIILIAKKDQTNRFGKVCWAMILYPIFVSTITYLLLKQ